MTDPAGVMKILVVSDAAPSRNGAGSYYHDLVPSLEARGIRVQMYSPTIDENGRWHAGFLLPLPGDSTQKLCLPDIRALSRLFREFQPQLLIIATPGVYGLTAARMACSKGLPFLTGFHTSFEQLTALYWPDSLQGKIVSWYFRKSNGYLFRHTAGVIGNSNAIMKQVQNMKAPATWLVGTPLAAEFMESVPATHTGRIRRCLFAGRLAREKNLEALFEAVKRLPELQFTIAGDGPLRGQTEQACRDYPNLDYIGWLSREQLKQAIDMHDAVLLPSYFETFGTIALEAMARQKLAVVSRGCGICEWPNLDQALVTIGENETLADKLAWLLQLEMASIHEMSHQARISALEFNSTVADEWLHIMRLVCSRINP
jgi:glycosyltransferase involved in cell wall biosynthesis